MSFSHWYVTVSSEAFQRFLFFLFLTDSPYHGQLFFYYFFYEQMTNQELFPLSSQPNNKKYRLDSAVPLYVKLLH